ncbi:helicase-related protein [Chitinivorax sp. PXF-14]|uniref:helicase-related protein n=1 Tax=Chitinivorax sp. PXF-14 TaxID=3230488 RepID=UPI003465D5B2
MQSRVHGDSVETFRREVHAFVLKAMLLADKHGVEATRFFGALVSDLHLASQRFQVIEDRIIEAGIKAREEESTALTQSALKLAFYPETFTTARQMPRRFIAVLGPTNSGKTHRAMEALAKAASGVYLAPLRLLALENYERLDEQGVKVSLVTGEERRLTEGATHIASTIEMLDTHRRVEVAVIDEIQMLDDPDRGSAWTAAVCGAPAETVYLVGALNARPAIEALATRLNCPLEITELSRKSPLTVEAQPLRSVKALKKGDAVIAFSRKDVLYWRDQITAAGLSVATVYGNLSPEVRRAQAKRFREGEAEVLVGTDAIGMGLNMPISRIIFTTAEKFDGQEQDVIEAWLAQQIAGRAGRFGLHEEGFVAGYDDNTHKMLRKLLKAKIDPLRDSGFRVAPSMDHLNQIMAATGEPRLEKLLLLFAKNIDVNDEFFMPTNLADQVERAAWLDALPLSLADRLLLSLVPISTRIPRLNDALASWAKNLAQGKVSGLEEQRYQHSRYPLQAAEDACKLYSAYAWLSYRMPKHFPDGEAAIDLARATSFEVDKMLQAQNARGRQERSQQKRQGGKPRRR